MNKLENKARGVTEKEEPEPYGIVCIGVVVIIGLVSIGWIVMMAHDVVKIWLAPGGFGCFCN